MNHTIRFTKQAIESLPTAQPGTRDYYEDPRYKSLRLSVTDRGGKSWVMQRRIHGRVSRITLGRYPDLAPENAIKRLEQTVGRLAHGEDPRTTQRAKDSRKLSLQDSLELMLKVRPLKESTATSYRNLVNKGAFHDWADKPLVTITPDLVAERHAYLVKNSGGPYANVAMRTLRAIWNFVAYQYEDKDGASLLPLNPVQRLSKTKAWVRVARRKTYIEKHQLPAWFESVQRLRAEPWGTSSQTVGDYLVVLLLTGLRRNEAAALTWSHIDLQAKTLRITETKNSDEHVLPLSDYLVALFETRKQNAGESAFIFPADNSAGHLKEPRAHIRRVETESGIEFILHDLRRTFATIVEEMDLSHYALKRLLNHRMTGDVTAGYIGNNTERLRAPMQQITDAFLAFGEIRQNNKVVPIKPKQQLRSDE